MRPTTILLASSLLLAALATPAQADPVPACPATHVGGMHTLALREDCTAEVGVLDGAYCVGGWGGHVERDVAGHTVRVLVCDGGLGQRLEPAALATSAPRCGQFHADGAFVSIALRSDCTVVVTPHVPASGAVAATAVACPAKSYDNGEQRVAVQSDCDVYVKPFECLTGGIYEERARVGPAAVYVHRCTFGPPPSTQDHEGPGQTVHDRVDGVTDAIGEPDVPDLLEDPCDRMVGQRDCGAPRGAPVSAQTVTVDLPRTYECVWAGSYQPVLTAGPVVVREYRCESAEPQGADRAKPCNGVYYAEVPAGPYTVYFGGLGCVGVHGTTGAPVDPVQALRDFACSQMMSQGDCGGAPRSASDCPVPDVRVTYGTGLYFDDGCTPDPHLHVSTLCLGGGGRTVTVYDRGNVHVSFTLCDSPSGGTASSTSAGGPCDRLSGTFVEGETLTWSMDDRCRHDVWVDPADCLNEAQWTKGWQHEQVSPNLTLHYTVCRLG